MTRVKEQIIITSAQTTAGTATIHETGQICMIISSTNNTTNAITYQIDIDDKDGYNLYTSGAGLADNSEIKAGSLVVPVDYGSVISVTPSAAPGASTLIADIMLYIIKA